MALKETVNQLQDLLGCVTKDLEKGSKGNKAASQRVRTGTVKLEKIAKLYRKQSVANEKTLRMKPKATSKVEAKAKSAASTKKKPAAAKPAKKAGRK